MGAIALHKECDLDYRNIGLSVKIPSVLNGSYILIKSNWLSSISTRKWKVG
jgi:hypothetical protein